ncbi:hypothetical protein IJG66_01015 [Candidatus Saccharibacteria bacterium]|nr:hypothetical protein [Candidatus Saccharibacteria bacterium]
MRQVKPIIWGLAIIALGIIFGGNAIGLFNIDLFFDGWWTLFIIVPSAISLITDKDKLSNLICLTIGVILLLAAQNVFSYDVAWKVILALALVAAGLSIIYHNVIRNKNDKEVEAEIKSLKNDDTMDAQMAAFSGTERVYDNEEFSGANLMAVFGGIDLDLRHAIIKKDTVIKAFCLFGGIDIKTPDDVSLKVKSGFIFGGISDARKNSVEKGKHTIYIDAGGGFGGISINDKEKKGGHKKSQKD